MNGRRTAGWLTGALAAGILVITFWPTAVDEPVSGDVTRVIGALHEAGAPREVDYNAVEFTANVLMFLPFGAAAAAALPPRRWWLAGVAGFGLSGVAELGQLVLLPGRVGSAYDVLANTAGAMLGSLLVALLRRRAPAVG